MVNADAMPDDDPRRVFQEGAHPMTDTAREAAIEHFRERCASCGAFMNTSRPGTAWAAVGEFGEDTEYTCHRCTAKPGFRLLAGNGTADPKWCGYVKAGSSETQTGAERRAEPIFAASHSILNPNGETK